MAKKVVRLAVTHLTTALLGKGNSGPNFGCELETTCTYKVVVAKERGRKQIFDFGTRQYHLDMISESSKWAASQWNIRQNASNPERTTASFLLCFCLRVTNVICAELNLLYLPANIGQVVIFGGVVVLFCF